MSSKSVNWPLQKLKVPKEVLFLIKLSLHRQKEELVSLGQTEHQQISHQTVNL